MGFDLPFSHALPLLRAGGAFLVAVGAGVVLGGFWPRRLWAFLAAGAFAGSVLAALIARADVPRLGSPSRFQLYSLIVAVAFEIAGIAWVNSRLRARGRRTLLLATLLVVGAHFSLMIPAFGPFFGLLAVLGVGNATVGLAFAPQTPWQVFWKVDGFLKLAVGLLLLGSAS